MFNGSIMSGNEKIADVKNNKVIPINMYKLPLYLCNGGDFEIWLQSRAIDRHRPNSRLLKKVLRITNSDDVNTVLKVNGATITDNYWVKSSDNINLTWDTVKFSKNYFSDLALYGNFESFNKIYDKELDYNTPELTNIGSYEKCWKLENNEWWLYKQGTKEEIFSELFIAKLCEELGFFVAEYKEENRYIKTKNFTNNKYNFEPAFALVGDEEDYIFNFDKIEKLNKNFIKDYLDILYVDAICFNMDRHTYNYGFLRCKNTGEFLKMAPNFDNNIALISRGYGKSPINTNPLLIDLFIELLKEKNIKYSIPNISKKLLQNIAENIMVNENIDINYVVEMVFDRNEYLKKNI